MTVNPNVLILDGSIYPDIYNPTRHWRDLLRDATVRAVHLPSGETIADLSGFTHVIVTGSEASIVGDDFWFQEEARLVSQAVHRGLPVLASCFGHQMLARELSGRQHVRSAPTPEIGWIPVHLQGKDPLTDGLPDPFWVFASHFDEVIDPPAPWRVLGHTPHCSVHIMRYGDRPIWGLQAHPEINPQDGRTLLEGFLLKAPDKAHLVRPALDQPPRDDGVAQVIADRFLRIGIAEDPAV